eukprot:SAG11_NODE_28916_length_316_cov_0.930876_1_plen_28_part_10
MVLLLLLAQALEEWCNTFMRRVVQLLRD